MKSPMTSSSLLIAAALLCTSIADAAIIDFTDRSIWGSSGSGAVTNSYDGLQVTLQAFNAAGATSYSNTAFDGSDSAICGSLMCQSDGIGIGGDEVSFGGGPLETLDRLTVTFNQAVNVDSIWVLDLFAAVRGDSGGAEVFQVAANGLDGEWASWTGTDTSGAGLLAATLDGATASSSSNVFTNVFSLSFFTTNLGLFSSPQNSDFALAGLEVTAIEAAAGELATVTVPEPTSLGLFALGLFGAFGVTRRKARRS